MLFASIVNSHDVRTVILSRAGSWMEAPHDCQHRKCRSQTAHSSTICGTFARPPQPHARHVRVCTQRRIGWIHSDVSSQCAANAMRVLLARVRAFRSSRYFCDANVTQQASSRVSRHRFVWQPTAVLMWSRLNSEKTRIQIPTTSLLVARSDHSQSLFRLRLLQPVAAAALVSVVVGGSSRSSCSVASFHFSIQFPLIYYKNKLAKNLLHVTERHPASQGTHTHRQAVSCSYRRMRTLILCVWSLAYSKVDASF